MKMYKENFVFYYHSLYTSIYCTEYAAHDDPVLDMSKSQALSSGIVSIVKR